MLQAHTWTLFISSWPLFRPLTAYEKPITKPVINTIECDGGQSDLPRGVYGPTGGVYVEGKSLTNPLPIWSHVNFTNASDLCSASGNLAANIGGVCVEDPLTPSIRQIRFCVTLAWLASLFNNELARYCSKVCHCSTNEDDYLSNSLLRAQAACSLSAVIDQSWVDYFNAPPGQSGLLPPSHIRPEGPEPTGEEGIEDLVVPGERGLVGGVRPTWGWVPGGGSYKRVRVGAQDMRAQAGGGRCRARCDLGRCRESARRGCPCVVRQVAKASWVPVGCRVQAMMRPGG